MSSPGGGEVALDQFGQFTQASDNVLGVTETGKVVERRRLEDKFVVCLGEGHGLFEAAPSSAQVPARDLGPCTCYEQFSAPHVGGGNAELINLREHAPSFLRLGGHGERVGQTDKS